MKKHILSLAVAAAMIGAIATGCSSEKKAGGSDTTKTKDTASAVTPVANPAQADSAVHKRDTAKTDTTHH